MAFRAHGPRAPRAFGYRPSQAARRNDRAIETMVSGPGKAVRKRSEQAWSSTTGARSAAPPACSDGFDNVDGGPERGVYIQMRSIEQVRIRRCFEGGGGAIAVALVAAEDVGKYVGLAHPVPELGRPPAGPHLRRRVDENLHVRVREDDGADVAAIEDGTGRGTAEIALEVEKRGAHIGERRDHRGRLADLIALEQPFLEPGRVERARRRNCPRDIVEPVA